MHVTREACMDGPHDGGEEYGAVYCISSSRVGSCCLRSAVGCKPREAVFRAVLQWAGAALRRELPGQVRAQKAR